MIKQKPCKGQNKALGFQSCGKLTNVERLKYGLCSSCYPNFLLTDERGKIIMQKAMSFGKQKVIKDNKSIESEKTKKMRENVKTLSNYKNDLQKEINLIVRLIDKGHPCIATGSYEGKMNAGHYIGIGANETIRFHLENIWLQSEHSNMWKSGDTLRYQDGIVKLYGKEYLEHLNSFKMIPLIKLSIEEIKDKISICRGIAKWLKSQDRVYSNLDRLSIREEFNKKIGIY